MIMYITFFMYILLFTYVFDICDNGSSDVLCSLFNNFPIKMSFYVIINSLLITRKTYTYTNYASYFLKNAKNYLPAYLYLNFRLIMKKKLL